MHPESRSREARIFALCKVLVIASSSVFGREAMPAVLVVLLVMLLLGALPTWPHSRSWGYAPSGGLGLVL